MIHSDPDPVDLAFLLDLPPPGIDSVILRRSLVENSMGCLPHLLRGLIRLSASNADLTDKTLPHIAKLTGLNSL
jgi:hypothetical protein